MDIVVAKTVQMYITPREEYMHTTTRQLLFIRTAAHRLVWQTCCSILDLGGESAGTVERRHGGRVGCGGRRECQGLLTKLCTDRINTVYCLLFTVYCLLFTVCVFICSLAKTVDHPYQTLSVAIYGPIRRHLGESPAGIEVPLMTLPGLAISRLGPHRSSEFRQRRHTTALWSVAPDVGFLSLLSDPP
jgi:hypothetical protein